MRTERGVLVTECSGCSQEMADLRHAVTPLVVVRGTYSGGTEDKSASKVFGMFGFAHSFIQSISNLLVLLKGCRIPSTHLSASGKKRKC